jgi:hypothetical protein
MGRDEEGAEEEGEEEESEEELAPIVPKELPKRST